LLPLFHKLHVHCIHIHTWVATASKRLYAYALHWLVTDVRYVKGQAFIITNCKVWAPLSHHCQTAHPPFAFVATTNDVCMRCAVCCAGKFKVSNNCAFTWPKGQYGMCGDLAGQSRWMQSTTPKTLKAGDTLKIQVCGAAVCQQTECMFLTHAY
jgi:hypothetical protein